MILFYSNYCKYSKAFIEMLEKTGMIMSFNVICVDKNEKGHRPVLMYNYNIKEVPTIIIDDITMPGILAKQWLLSQMEQEPPAQQESCDIPTTQEGPGPISASASSRFGDNFVGCGDNQRIMTLDNDDDEEVEKHRGKFTIPMPTTDPSIMAESIKTSIQTPSEIKSNPFVKNDTKKGTLKAKQLENKYNKMLHDRNLTK